MRYYDYSPMYQSHSYFWTGGLIHVLLNILVWGLIIYLVVYLFRKFASNHSNTCCGLKCSETDEEMEEINDEYYLGIAKERYVKGEIDKRQYDELKREFSHEVTQEVVDKHEKSAE